MTTFSEVKVLGPGTTEVQQTEVNEQLNQEVLPVLERDTRGLPEGNDSPVENASSTGYAVEAALQPLNRDRVEIGSLLDTRLRMRGTLTLEMEQEGEFYIAKCDELNEFGYDYDPIGAVQDVRVSIAELYWELKENQHRLGADLAETWRKLSELVYEA